jgi:RNA polymerase sigma-70 factor (ECF subfamily)
VTIGRYGRKKGFSVLEDKLLIRKIKNGSREALSRLYEKYRDDLLRIGASLLNDKAMAEDAVHDTFVKFVRNSKDFVLTGSLKGYLAKCVANRARNIQKTSQRRGTVGLEEAQAQPSKTKKPDEWIIITEEFERLNNAMAQLPYEQREAVIMHIQAKMRFREIAKMQATSIKTAQSRYRYGIDKLRSMLNGEVQK